jgi:hypothetical protein
VIRYTPPFINVVLAVFLVATGANGASLLPAMSPDNFAAQINASLAKSLPDEQFCRKFWERKSLSICNEFPWKYALAIKPGINTRFSISKEKGFFDFLNLSYQCKGSVCRLGLDLLPVWSELSELWSKDVIYSGILLHPQPLNNGEAQLYSDKMGDWLRKISALLSIPTLKFHQIFFLNDPQLATSLGFSFPQIVSGGSRGDYLVFVGQRLPPSWLLHELLHSYTSLPGLWWKGPGHFPHAILNEGFAVSVQLQELWNDDLPPSEIGSLFCNDLRIASKKLNGKIFRLFDNNEFRTFDSGGYHPGYLVGASVVHSLRTRLTLDRFKSFWNQIGLPATSVKKTRLGAMR